MQKAVYNIVLYSLEAIYEKYQKFVYEVYTSYHHSLMPNQFPILSRERAW